MAVLTNPSDLAREALKLMAARRIAPTPVNYARYYHEIAGTGSTARDGSDQREAGPRHDWGALLRELIRQLEVRQTGARLALKRQGLERVLIGFASDAQLFDKLRALVSAWGEAPEPAGTPIEVLYETPASAQGQEAAQGGRLLALSLQAENVRQLKELLALTLELGVADRLERFPALAEQAQQLARNARLARGVEAWAAYASALRQFLFRLAARAEADGEQLDALLHLLGLLVDNIGELVEDDPWLAGQVALLREVINAPLTTERIEQAERRFKEVAYKQSMLKHSLREAKASLKSLIALFVQRLGEMTRSTTDYHGKIEIYAERLQHTDDISKLKLMVDELMDDTRGMQVDMLRSHEEMVDARRHVEAAQLKVRGLQAELEQMSQDQLTGALNRRGLEDAVQREMSRAVRRNTALCVALLDLDNFKRLNDTYGQQAGDDALVHLTTLAKTTLRSTDITARTGGEEFVILFSETALAQAVNAMSRLRRELTKPFLPHSNERSLLTFSAGVAQFKPGETREAVLERADRAMHQAKLQGKDRVVAAAAA